MFRKSRRMRRETAAGKWRRFAPIRECGPRAIWKGRMGKTIAEHKTTASLARSAFRTVVRPILSSLGDYWLQLKLAAELTSPPAYFGQVGWWRERVLRSCLHQ